MNTPCRIFLYAVSLIVVSFATPASAQTLLSVDFNGYYYNLTESGYTGLTPDSAGATVSFPYTIGSYSVTVAGSALTQWHSDAGPDVGTELYRDYIAADGWNSLTLTIGGLAANTQYDFRPFAWRQGAGAPTLTYTPTDGTGGSNGTVSYDGTVLDIDNINFFSTLMSLTSNNSGQIVVTVSTDSYGGTVMNGFELSAVPEPGTGILLGLTGLCWLSRRRKTAR